MPSFTFTDLALKNLAAPHARQTDYQDAAQSGFGIRVYGTGTKRFYFRYRFAGKIQRLNLGNYPATKLADARLNARKAHLMVREGYNPKRHKTFGYDLPAEPGTPEANSRADALRLKPLIDRYLAERCVEDKNKDSTIEDKARVLNNIVKTTWVGKTLPEITSAHVKDLIKTISARQQYALANKTHAYLKHFFNWAVDEGLATVSPCDRLKRPHEQPTESLPEDRADVIPLGSGKSALFL